MTMRHEDVVAVVIGRNEGARLATCLASLAGRVARIVYVDSGSTDGSRAIARRAGAEVVSLDTARPFSAARARNAGVDRLAEDGLPGMIQFVDGDCVLDPGWLPRAIAEMRADPDLAVVCGRRREAHPEASLWNRLIDREWNTPVGPARACGGDALIRARAFSQVGGFDPRFVAGEEPELCVRLRHAGWGVSRIDAEMTRHDAAMATAGQWWRRAVRAGYAYAMGAARHGAPPERHHVPELRRALLWGAALPAAAVLGAFVTPWALLLLLAWPAQIARMALRDGDVARAAALTLTKPAEALGAARWLLDRLRGRAPALIEYR